MKYLRQVRFVKRKCIIYNLFVSAHDEIQIATPQPTADQIGKPSTSENTEPLATTSTPTTPTKTPRNAGMCNFHCSSYCFVPFVINPIIPIYEHVTREY